MAKRKQQIEDKELLEFFHTGKKTLKMFLSRSTGREQWEIFGEDILADWIKDRPGSRPWPWWEFSSPDHPQTFEPINLAAGLGAIQSGFFSVVTHFPGPEIFPEPPYLFESEASYLRRKKLLFKGELERIKPDNFEPKETYPFFVQDIHGKYSRIDDPVKVCSESEIGLAKYDLVDVHYPARFKIHNE